MKLFAIVAVAAFATGASAQDTDGADLLTPSPTAVGVGFPTLGFAGAFSSGPTAEVCPEEAAAVEACMVENFDLSNLDGAMECALCGVNAMGDDFMNILNEADYCSEWTPCVVEFCSERCLEPMIAFQVCAMGYDCGVGPVETTLATGAASAPDTEGTVPPTSSPTAAGVGSPTQGFAGSTTSGPTVVGVGSAGTIAMSFAASSLAVAMTLAMM